MFRNLDGIVFLFFLAKNVLVSRFGMPHPGDTPLMLAVESEMTLAVTKLVNDGGADVNAASETTGE